MAETDYTPDDWDLQPDGTPRAVALVGATAIGLLPGHVVLRLEYVETQEQQRRFREGHPVASFLQVAMEFQHARSLAEMLAGAAEQAEAIAATPRN